MNEKSLFFPIFFFNKYVTVHMLQKGESPALEKNIHQL